MFDIQVYYPFLNFVREIVIDFNFALFQIEKDLLE